MGKVLTLYFKVKLIKIQIPSAPPPPPQIIGSQIFSCTCIFKQLCFWPSRQHIPIHTLLSPFLIMNTITYTTYPPHAPKVSNVLSSIVSSYIPSVSVQTPEWAEADACQKCDMPFFWNMKAMWEKKTMGRRQVLKDFLRL